MKIIESLNSYYTYHELIHECIKSAKENPYDIYYFITPYNYEVEKTFFNQTHYLVNIEIMNYSQLMKELFYFNHLTQYSLLSLTSLTYHLRQILKEEDLHCFQTQYPYPLIQTLSSLMKDFDLSLTQYKEEDVQQAKLKDYIHIYHSLKKRMKEDEILSYESLLNSCSFKKDSKIHFYIDGIQWYHPASQKILKKLDEAYDVCIYYTHHQDNRLFNKPFDSLTHNATIKDQPTFMSQNLFLSHPQQSNEEITYFIESTPISEVKRVIYTLYQRLVDENLHYKDFVIVYPDTTYLPIIKQTLDELSIPHRLASVHSCIYDKDYQFILTQLQKEGLSSFSSIAEAFLQEDLSSPYQDYFKSLLSFHDCISYVEFSDFFKVTYQKDNISVSNNEDTINVCQVNEVYFSAKKHFFFIGMNETVFPKVIKDTHLLLDEDIQILNNLSISTPLSTSLELGLHYLDIFRAFNHPYLSLNLSYATQTLSGGVLLESSLFKQLKKMYHFTPLKRNDYLPMDEFYLQGGINQDLTELNKRIDDFKQSKNQPLSLSNELASSLYKSTLSISQIESYNKCPFQYFIQYGLGIYPKQEESLQANELGSLVHYVLSQCVDTDINSDSCVDNYILQNEILKEKIDQSSLNQYFIKQLKRDLKLTLAVLKRQLSLSSFTITSKEEKIEEDMEMFRFKGFVDRIDEYKNYFSIIDYKSSDKDIDLNLAMQGFNIQMLWYLKMVEDMKKKDPGAVLYFNTKKRILSTDYALKDEADEKDFFKQYRFHGYVVDDEKHEVIKAYDPYFEKNSDIIKVTYVKSRNEYKGNIITPSQLDHLLKKIEEHIIKLYNQMMNGEIGIKPKGSDQSATHTQVNPCRYCPNHSVCSFDVFYNDYELVEFLDVDNILGGEEDAI